MPPTLTEFAVVATNAVRGSAGAWNAMTVAEQATVKAQLRYGLDYLAAQHSERPEDIYTASPGDPPPTAPPA